MKLVVDITKILAHFFHGGQFNGFVGSSGSHDTMYAWLAMMIRVNRLTKRVNEMQEGLFEFKRGVLEC